MAKKLTKSADANPNPNVPQKQCPECNSDNPFFMRECWSCGHAFPFKKRGPSVNKTAKATIPNHKMIKAVIAANELLKLAGTIDNAQDLIEKALEFKQDPFGFMSDHSDVDMNQLKQAAIVLDAVGTDEAASELLENFADDE